MDKNRIIELAKKGIEITDDRESEICKTEGCWACKNCEEPSCNLLALFEKIIQEAEKT